MNKTLIGFMILSLGVALGRMFDGVPATAAAIGHQGGGAAKCVSKNGDVNADGSVNLSDAITLLGNLFLGNPTQLEQLCTTQGSSGLPESGQTKCYGQGGMEIPCDGATCPGQDGFYQRVCSPEGRLVDNQDGTVTDTCTGLMWQKDTADTDGDGQSTEEDFLPWCGALAYCENLSFAGHDDWRLPNVRELQSIVDCGRFDPSIDPVFGAFLAEYWSSTTYAPDSKTAWDVYFDVGDVYHDPKVNGSYVRAVRSLP